MKPIRYLVFHHSASSLTTTAADIDRWHRDRGWSGCGYAYVVEADGRLVAARGLRRRLAANPPHNGDSIAVCLVGDNTQPARRGWTREQVATAWWLIDALRRLVPDIEVVGHRDVGSTECPGGDVRELLGI
jgi:N-acetylmuramoyl-L-alanine amidase